MVYWQAKDAISAVKMQLDDLKAKRLFAQYFDALPRLPYRGTGKAKSS